jgi:hypothetical protein
MTGTPPIRWRVDAGSMPACPIGSVVWFVNEGASAQVVRDGLGSVGSITAPSTTQTASPDGSRITLVNSSEGWHATLSRIPAPGQQLGNWEAGGTPIPAHADPRYASLEAHVRAGGRLIVYEWVVSIVILTFKRPSGIMLVRPGQSAAVVGLPYILISLFFGWWGIPWGPIYTIGSISRNLRGGRDVTRLVFPDLPSTPAPAIEPGPKRGSGLPPGHR